MHWYIYVKMWHKDIWICIKVSKKVWEYINDSVQFSHSVVSDSLPPHGLDSPWNSPGHNTGVGSLSLLQGIFPTQGSNPGLPHCRQILYQLSHKRSPLLDLEEVLIREWNPLRKNFLTLIKLRFYRPPWNCT